jgi:hypothetical protein
MSQIKLICPSPRKLVPDLSTRAGIVMCLFGGRWSFTGSRICTGMWIICSYFDFFHFYSFPSNPLSMPFSFQRKFAHIRVDHDVPLFPGVPVAHQFATVPVAQLSSSISAGLLLCQVLFVPCSYASLLVFSSASCYWLCANFAVAKLRLFPLLMCKLSDRIHSRARPFAHYACVAPFTCPSFCSLCVCCSIHVPVFLLLCVFGYIHVPVFLFIMPVLLHSRAHLFPLCVCCSIHVPVLLLIVHVLLHSRARLFAIMRVWLHSRASLFVFIMRVLLHSRARLFSFCVCSSIHVPVILLIMHVLLHSRARLFAHYACVAPFTCLSFCSLCVCCWHSMPVGLWYISFHEHVRFCTVCHFSISWWCSRTNSSQRWDSWPWSVSLYASITQQRRVTEDIPPCSGGTLFEFSVQPVWHLPLALLAFYLLLDEFAHECVNLLPVVAHVSVCLCLGICMFQ